MHVISSANDSAQHLILLTHVTSLQFTYTLISSFINTKYKKSDSTTPCLTLSVT